MGSGLASAVTMWTASSHFTIWVVSVAFSEMELLFGLPTLLSSILWLFSSWELETDLDLFWITAHCYVALGRLANLSVLKSICFCRSNNIYIKSWSWEFDEMTMWNDLHGVYLAHKNSLNGGTSYFYLLKEIEVRDGMGTKSIPLSCSWAGYLRFSFFIYKMGIRRFLSQGFYDF